MRGGLLILCVFWPWNGFGSANVVEVATSSRENPTEVVETEPEPRGNLGDSMPVPQPNGSDQKAKGLPGVGDVKAAPPQEELPDPASFMKINYASKDKGADVLESSDQAKGAGSLVLKDKDKYCITPCETNLFVVIQLSEDITVEKFVLANYEQYSSTVKDFQVYGSLKYPTTSWKLLGNFTARPGQGDQQFGLRSTVRYLRFNFLTHWGSEYFCTLSQIRVHGTTVIASAHEDLDNHARELEQIHIALTAADDIKAILQDFEEEEEEEEEEEAVEEEELEPQGKEEPEEDQKEDQEAESSQESIDGEDADAESGVESSEAGHREGGDERDYRGSSSSSPDETAASSEVEEVESEVKVEAEVDVGSNEEQTSEHDTGDGGDDGGDSPPLAEGSLSAQAEVATEVAAEVAAGEDEHRVVEANIKSSSSNDDDDDDEEEGRSAPPSPPIAAAGVDTVAAVHKEEGEEEEKRVDGGQSSSSSSRQGAEKLESPPTSDATQPPSTSTSGAQSVGADTETEGIAPTSSEVDEQPSSGGSGGDGGGDGGIGGSSSDGSDGDDDDDEVETSEGHSMLKDMREQGFASEEEEKEGEGATTAEVDRMAGGAANNNAAAAAAAAAAAMAPLLPAAAEQGATASSNETAHLSSYVIAGGAPPALAVNAAGTGASVAGATVPRIEAVDGSLPPPPPPRSQLSQAGEEKAAAEVSTDAKAAAKENEDTAAPPLTTRTCKSSSNGPDHGLNACGEEGEGEGDSTPSEHHQTAEGGAPLVVAVTEEKDGAERQASTSKEELGKRKGVGGVEGGGGSTDALPSDHYLPPGEGGERREGDGHNSGTERQVIDLMVDPRVVSSAESTTSMEGAVNYDHDHAEDDRDDDLAAADTESEDDTAAKATAAVDDSDQSATAEYDDAAKAAATEGLASVIIDSISEHSPPELPLLVEIEKKEEAEAKELKALKAKKVNGTMTKDEKKRFRELKEEGKNRKAAPKSDQYEASAALMEEKEQESGGAEMEMEKGKPKSDDLSSSTAEAVAITAVDLSSDAAGPEASPQTQAAAAAAAAVTAPGSLSTSSSSDSSAVLAAAPPPAAPAAALPPPPPPPPPPAAAAAPKTNLGHDDGNPPKKDATAAAVLAPERINSSKDVDQLLHSSSETMKKGEQVETIKGQDVSSTKGEGGAVFTSNSTDDGDDGDSSLAAAAAHEERDKQSLSEQEKVEGGGEPTTTATTTEKGNNKTQVPLVPEECSDGGAKAETRTTSDESKLLPSSTDDDKSSAPPTKKKGLSVVSDAAALLEAVSVAVGFSTAPPLVKPLPTAPPQLPLEGTAAAAATTARTPSKEGEEEEEAAAAALIQPVILSKQQEASGDLSAGNSKPDKGGGVLPLLRTGLDPPTGLELHNPLSPSLLDELSSDQKPLAKKSPVVVAVAEVAQTREGKATRDADESPSLLVVEKRVENEETPLAATTKDPSTLVAGAAAAAARRVATGAMSLGAAAANQSLVDLSVDLSVVAREGGEGGKGAEAVKELLADRKPVEKLLLVKNSTDLPVLTPASSPEAGNEVVSSSSSSSSSSSAHQGASNATSSANAVERVDVDPHSKNALNNGVGGGAADGTEATSNTQAPANVTTTSSVSTSPPPPQPQALHTSSNVSMNATRVIGKAPPATTTTTTAATGSTVSPAGNTNANTAAAAAAGITSGNATTSSTAVGNATLPADNATANTSTAVNTATRAAANSHGANAAANVTVNVTAKSTANATANASSPPVTSTTAAAAATTNGSPATSRPSSSPSSHKNTSSSSAAAPTKTNNTAATTTSKTGVVKESAERVSGGSSSSSSSSAPTAQMKEKVKEKVKSVAASVDACLEGLNFTRFKEKVQEKVQQHMSGSGAGGNGHGGGNGGSNGGGGVAGEQQQGAGNGGQVANTDRIFKTMMDMIKSLEIGTYIMELYVVKLHTCYATVMEDVRNEHAKQAEKQGEATKLSAEVVKGLANDLERHTPAGKVLAAQMAALEASVALAEERVESLAKAAVLGCLLCFLVGAAGWVTALRQGGNFRRLELQQQQPQKANDRTEAAAATAGSGASAAALASSSVGPLAAAAVKENQPLVATDSAVTPTGAVGLASASPPVASLESHARSDEPVPDSSAPTFNDHPHNRAIEKSITQEARFGGRSPSAAAGPLSEGEMSADLNSDSSHVEEAATSPAVVSSSQSSVDLESTPRGTIPPLHLPVGVLRAAP